MTTEQVISAIGLIGFGGLIKSGFDYFIATKKAKQDAKHSFKVIRYKTIILLCYAMVHYDREKSTLVINRPNINSLDRLRNEVEAEFINMSLFASDNVILKMREFVCEESRITLNDLAVAMIKDLYGISTRLNSNHLT